MLDGKEPLTRAWRAAEIPAANGHGNARSMAKIHSVLACGGELGGVRLLSEEMLSRVLEVQVEGTDLIMNVPVRFGMGYGLPTASLAFPNKRVFFWGGWGGSVAIIDLDARMSIAYAMNRMTQAVMGDPRGAGVVISAYTAVATGAGTASVGPAG